MGSGVVLRIAARTLAGCISPAQEPITASRPACSETGSCYSAYPLELQLRTPFADKSCDGCVPNPAPPSAPPEDDTTKDIASDEGTATATTVFVVMVSGVALLGIGFCIHHKIQPKQQDEVCPADHHETAQAMSNLARQGVAVGEVGPKARCCY